MFILMQNQKRFAFHAKRESTKTWRGKRFASHAALGSLTRKLQIPSVTLALLECSPTPLDSSIACLAALVATTICLAPLCARNVFQDISRMKKVVRNVKIVQCHSFRKILDKLNVILPPLVKLLAWVDHLSSTWPKDGTPQATLALQRSHVKLARTAKIHRPRNVRDLSHFFSFLPFRCRRRRSHFLPLFFFFFCIFFFFARHFSSIITNN